MNMRCKKNNDRFNFHVDVGEYIEVNEKKLRVFSVFSKGGADYFYLSKLYENSNHYFLVYEYKQCTRRKYEVLSSFKGCEEGLEESIDIMFDFLDVNKNYRGLKRIK
tara:strand:- start:6552 stop:6872 length:321 start_codon:yes stop_codon:yes gene_type:complete